MLVETFGATLAEIRNHAGLSQATVAANAEISPGYYCAIETGRRPPPPGTTLVRILSALKCNDTETEALQRMAAKERGLSLLDVSLPAEVQGLISDLRTRAHILPPPFVRALRKHVREATD